MARITIEDCLEKVGNRFELVLLAAKRARQLALGSVEATVPWEKDKSTVVALREVASGSLFLTEAGEVRAINDPVAEDGEVQELTAEALVAQVRSQEEAKPAEVELPSEEEPVPPATQGDDSGDPVN